MSPFFRNKVSCDTSDLESRVMLASATMTSGTEGDARRENRSENESEQGSDQDSRERRPRRDAEPAGNSVATDSVEPVSSADPAATETSTSVGQPTDAQAVVDAPSDSTSPFEFPAPIGPVQGDRVTQAFPNPFSEPDIASTIFSANNRNFVTGNSDAGFVELQLTGDTLFANVITQETLDSIDELRAEVEAEGFDLDTLEGRNELSFRATDPLFPPEDDLIDLPDALNIAAAEIGPGETVAQGRLDQIANTISARRAELVSSATFVNNDISPDNTGPIVLTYNVPNPGVDGGDTPSITITDREPRNFTLEEITTTAPSLLDLQPGDTLTLPSNIRGEAFRAEGVARDNEAETLVSFNGDGSTFNDPELFNSPAFQAAVEDNFSSLDPNEPGIIIGDSESVSSVGSATSFEDGTDSIVSNLQVNVSATASFFPLASELELNTGLPAPVETLPDPNGFTELSLFLGFTDFDTEDPTELDLVTEDTFDELLEEAIASFEFFEVTDEVN